MIRRHRILLMMGVAAACVPAMTEAQSDVVVMRRVVAKPTRTPTPVQAPTPTPTPTPSGTPRPGEVGYYSWRVSPWQESGTCGEVGSETRDVTCVRTDGTAFADSYCTGNGSGQKPVSSQQVIVTATCTYAWQESDWSLPTTTCGSDVLTRDVSCVRSDQSVATPDLCPQPAPATQRDDQQTSGCGYQWAASEWSAPSANCGDATETRGVSCMRTDGATVADAQCAGAPPASNQHVYVTCGTGGGGGTVSSGFHWTTSDWGAPAPACGATVATRSVACSDSTGGVFGDSECAGDKPATTEPAISYATCTDGRTADHPYAWSVGSQGTASTTCGLATITYPVTCTDVTGAVVDDALCVAPRPAETGTATVTTGCTYHWTAGDFGAPQPACGPTVQTRAVTCTRTDGASVDGQYCSGQQAPAATQNTTDLSACTYGWTSGVWSPPSATCGPATETRAVACQRADGATVADASCDAATKPATIQASYETSGCGFTWQTGGWTTTPACGATSDTRTVSCLRSDGQTVDDAQCSVIGGKPATSQPDTDYSTCSYSWAVGPFPAPSSTCGTTTQNRSVSCLRSDGQVVEDARCSAQGVKPATSETTTQTSSCTYAWLPEAWGAATPACGPSTHSRTIDCQRSDLTIVASNLCSGTAPATSEATTDYSTCSYQWYVSAWQGTAGCGSTVTQNRTVYCQRSDGAQVGDAQCGDPSTKPASTQPITDYSQCSYAWQQTVGTWSSTCSAQATRTNQVTCVRQDGQAMADQSYCNSSTKPSTTDTGNFAGCTYSGTYGAPYSTCKAVSQGSTSGNQTTTLTACRRSDGTDVTSQNSSNSTKYPGCAIAGSQACTVVYTPTYKAYGACVPSSKDSPTGTQTAGIYSCTNPDGVSVGTAYCSPQSISQSCTVTYTPTYTYGTCTPGSQGSTTGTEQGTVTKCTASDGSAASLSTCGGSSSRTCSGITYAEAYGTCSSNSQTISSCTTTASDGNTGTIATSLCPSSAQTKTCTTPTAHTCGSMMTGYYVSSFNGNATHDEISSITGSVGGGSGSQSAALSFCQNATAPDSGHTYLKYCFYYDRGAGNLDTINALFTKNATSDTTTKTGSSSGFYGANCTG